MSAISPARRLRLPWYTYALAWTYAALLVFPLWFVLVSAFKTNLEIFTRPLALPTSWALDNFFQAWDRTEMGLAMINSFIVVGGSLALTLLLAVPAAYGLARMRTKAGVVTERIFSSGMLVPGFAALVPTVLLAIALGLFHTRTFLILYFPATALPLTVLLLTQFMRTVPVELEESALLDGARRWQILRHIYLPVVTPGVATVTILNFLTFWNEYIFSMLLLGSDARVRTIQVAIPVLTSLTRTDYGILMAACFLAMLPTLLIYAVLQRRLEDALLQGAVKG